MEQRTRELISALSVGTMSADEFIEAYFNGKPPSESQLMELLREGISRRDADAIEEAVVLLYVCDFDLRAFAASCRELLPADWHYKHEDIAQLLGEIKDPGAVDCLYEAATREHAYLDYDDTHQLARKCIKALSAIGSEAAVSRLRELSLQDNATVAEYARKELLHLA